MGRAAQLVGVFLASGLVTLAILSANLGIGPPRPRPAAEAPADKIDPRARSATARQLAASGRLGEAQDAYLEVLQTNPTDPVAMQGLIAVRRQLAGDDPAALRRQAAAYRQMIAQSKESPEHYSLDSLEILAAASTRAAAAIEEERGQAHRTGAAATPGISGAPPGGVAPRVTKSSQSAALNTPPATAPQPQPPPSPASSSPAPVSGGAGQPAANVDKAPASANQPAPATSADKPAPGEDQPAPAADPNKPAPGAAQPAAGQNSDVQETVAVLTPPGHPAVTPSQGTLVGIDCQKRTFVLAGSAGEEEYLTTPTVTIYVRTSPSRRLSDVCGLQNYLGHAVTTWTVPGADRRIASEVSIAP